MPGPKPFEHKKPPRYVSDPERWQPIFLEALAVEGTVWAACVTAGISRITAYRHRQKNEDFALAWADVENTVTDKLERRAVDLAMEGDTRMLEFLLKARKPDTYTERRRVEHSGAIRHDLQNKSDAELEELAAGLIDRLRDRAS